MTDSLGQMLRTIRKSKRIPVNEITSSLNITRAALGHWERGTYNPTFENIRNLLELYQVDEKTRSKITREYYKNTDLLLNSRNISEVSNVIPKIQAYTNPPALDSRDIPIHGVVMGGDGEGVDFYMNGEIIDHVPRPPALANSKGVYALYVSGMSMWPKYDDGELIYVSKTRPPVSGDYVIIEMKPTAGERAGKGYLKLLKSKQADKVVCSQFNPQRDDLTFSMDKIESLDRVLQTKDLIGF